MRVTGLLYCYFVAAWASWTAGCTTTYVEFEGECVIQEWTLSNITLRKRQICDLPPPTGADPEVRDRKPMNPNPYPGMFDTNPADSTDANLLEKRRAMKGMMDAKTQEEYDHYEQLYLKLGGDLKDVTESYVP